MKVKIIFLISFLFSLTIVSINCQTSPPEENNDDNDDMLIEGIPQYSNNGLGLKCLWIDSSFNAYDLASLQNTNDVDDKVITLSDTQQLLYNFCAPTISACNKQTGWMIYKNNKQQSCKVLSGDSYSNNAWGTMNMKNSKGEVVRTDLVIKMNTGEACGANKDLKSIVEFHLTCNENGKDGELSYISGPKTGYEDESSCVYRIKATSKNGCKISNYYALASFIDSNKIIFSIVFIALGLFLCFLGSKILVGTLVVISFIVTIGLIFVFAFSIVKVNMRDPAIGWVLMGVSILLGIVAAYLFYTFKRVFYAVIGATTGFILGQIIYTFVLRYIELNPIVVYWSTVFLSVILGLLVGILLVKHLVIISTSIIGSYLIIRGGSFVIGYFPNENMLIDLIKRQEYTKLKEVRLNII